MNRILAIGCALAVIIVPATTFATSISTSQAPAAMSGLEFVNAITMSAATNGTHLYQQPSSSSKVISMLTAGTKVTVLDKSSNGLWAHVQVGSATGYVHLKALK